MPIQELLKREVQTLPPTASCAEAARLMRDERIGSVVVAEEERPLGILTDRDLVLRVMASGEDPEKVTVRDAMSTRPVFISGERGLRQAIETMHELAVRRLPVVDDDQKLVGLLSLDDMVVLLAEQLSSLADTIRKEM